MTSFQSSRTCVKYVSIAGTGHDLADVAVGQELGREDVGPVAGVDVDVDLLRVGLRDDESVVVGARQDVLSRIVPPDRVDAPAVDVQTVQF